MHDLGQSDVHVVRNRIPGTGHSDIRFSIAIAQGAESVESNEMRPEKSGLERHIYEIAVTQFLGSTRINS
jgi:hypothetical protein